MSTFTIIDYRTMTMREMLFAEGFTSAQFYSEIDDKLINVYVGSGGCISEDLDIESDKSMSSIRREYSEIYIFRKEWEGVKGGIYIRKLDEEKKTHATKQDLERFERLINEDIDVEPFLLEYVGYDGNSYSYAYSLLLNAAILFDNDRVAKIIFRLNTGNILTYCDDIGYSSISRILYGKHELLEMAERYINSNKENFVKIDCCETDKNHIYCVISATGVTEENVGRYINILDSLYSNAAECFKGLLGSFDEFKQ